MDDSTRKALYQNALLMVRADGVTEPKEVGFMVALRHRLNIPAEAAASWQAELDQEKDPQLRSLPDPHSTTQALELLIAAAAADAAFAPAEKRLLVAFGKAAGLSLGELKALVAQRWRSNVLDDLFGAPPYGETVYVVSDHFEKLEAFLSVNPRVRFEVVTLAEAVQRALRPACFTFHVAPDKKQSLEMLGALRRQAMGAKLIPVVARHQAFQISYLQEAGAFRCLVEDVYPGELERLLSEAHLFT